jgi:hypothetical protein
MRQTLSDRLLSRYPTTSLLRSAVADVMGERYIAELPSDPVEPMVLAERITGLAQALGREDEFAERLRNEDALCRSGSEAQRTSPRSLGSKYAFFAEACARISRTMSFRATFVGPVFLFPPWMIEKRNRFKHTPNFSVAVRRFLQDAKAWDYESVRLILRNADRFAVDYGRIVKGADRNRLVQDMLQAVTVLWGENGDEGPPIRCIDPGYLHLPHIFDDAVLVGTRPSAGAEVDGGWIETSADVVARERDRFDNVFDRVEQSQSEAIEKLQSFLRTMWNG